MGIRYSVLFVENRSFHMDLEIDHQHKNFVVPSELKQSMFTLVKIYW